MPSYFIVLAFCDVVMRVAQHTSARQMPERETDAVYTRYHTSPPPPLKFQQFVFFACRVLNVERADSQLNALHAAIHQNWRCNRDVKQTALSFCIRNMYVSARQPSDKPQQNQAKAKSSTSLRHHRQRCILVRYVFIEFLTWEIAMVDFKLI